MLNEVFLMLLVVVVFMRCLLVVARGCSVYARCSLFVGVSSLVVCCCLLFCCLLFVDHCVFVVV